MNNDDRDRKISETHEAVLLLAGKYESDHELLTKAATTLYGNGKVGLCTKVHLLTWVLGVVVGLGTVIGGGLAVHAVAAALGG